MTPPRHLGDCASFSVIPLETRIQSANCQPDWQDLHFTCGWTRSTYYRASTGESKSLRLSGKATWYLFVCHPAPSAREDMYKRRSDLLLMRRTNNRKARFLSFPSS